MNTKISERNRHIIDRQQTVVLPAWMKDAIEIFAKQNGMKKSEVFRAALHAFAREDESFSALIIACRDQHQEKADEEVYTEVQKEILDRLKDEKETLARLKETEKEVFS